MYTKEEVQKYIGAEIGYLCEQHHMTIYRLSQQTGIAQTALAEIVQCKTMPTIMTLVKICQVFDISLAQFFSEEKAAGV